MNPNLSIWSKIGSIYSKRTNWLHMSKELQAVMALSICTEERRRCSAGENVGTITGQTRNTKKVWRLNSSFADCQKPYSRSCACVMICIRKHV